MGRTWRLPRPWQGISRIRRLTFQPGNNPVPLSNAHWRSKNHRAAAPASREPLERSSGASRRPQGRHAGKLCIIPGSSYIATWTRRLQASVRQRAASSRRAAEGQRRPRALVPISKTRTATMALGGGNPAGAVGCGSDCRPNLPPKSPGSARRRGPPAVLLRTRVMRRLPLPSREERKRSFLLKYRPSGNFPLDSLPGAARPYGRGCSKCFPGAPEGRGRGHQELL